MGACNEPALPEIDAFEVALQRVIEGGVPVHEHAVSLWKQVTDTPEYAALCALANRLPDSPGLLAYAKDSGVWLTFTARNGKSAMLNVGDALLAGRKGTIRGAAIESWMEDRLDDAASDDGLAKEAHND